jgi:transcriptional regulator with XRE-family HTH domain
MTFGEKLKKSRNEAGLSQEKLAELIMVSRSAVAKWETDKGMPDINNLKLIAQALNISIDYLLDNENSLDMSVIRKPINLNDYTDGKVNIVNKKKIKDRVIRSHFPNAEINTLIAEEIMTKGEKAVDIAVAFLTPLMIDMIKLSKTLNHVGEEVYLVNDVDKQYIVAVTDEYIESRLLPEKISEEKFVIGNYKFLKCSPIRYA